MGKSKAFSNSKYLLSGRVFSSRPPPESLNPPHPGSKHQGFGIRGKVKPGGKVSREGAFPEGPGNVLNSSVSPLPPRTLADSFLDSDEAFSTFKCEKSHSCTYIDADNLVDRRQAQSNGSRDARASAADKRQSYLRTRAHDSDSDSDNHSSPSDQEDQEEQESEPDSDDLEGETAKERRKRQKREGKVNAAPASAARVLSDGAKASLARAEREQRTMREPIVLPDSSDDDDDALFEQDVLEDKMKRQLSPATFAAYLTSKSKLSTSRNASVGPSSSLAALLVPSSNKQRLFRDRSPTSSDSDSNHPTPKRRKPTFAKSGPAKKPNLPQKPDPRLSHVCIGNRTFDQKAYDSAPEVDPSILAILDGRSDEGGSNDGDAPGQAGVVARRERRERRRMDEIEKSAQAKKKAFKDARGHGYSNPRRN